ncbi:MAG: hypothetical protein J6X28_02975 [Bacilli bacterium]|nr:hypothetical protein [Bacilli bacterium]
MEVFVDVFLPVVLYIVAIILLIVLIVVALRLLKILDKVDRLVDNIDDKVNTFNDAFAVMKRASDSISSITDSFVFSASALISKLFGKFRGNYKEEEDYE